MPGMLSRAITDSLAVFDTTPKIIGLTVVGALVTAVIVWRARGTEALKKHIIENILIVFSGAIATWILVFAFIYIRLPYKMLRESNTNISKVIEEKRQLSITINALNAELGREKDRIKDLENRPVHYTSPESADNEITKRKIQHQLSGYINSGLSLQDEWNKRLGGPAEEQRQSASAVQDWNKAIEDYLRTIPRGEIYIMRFRNPARSGGTYPVGIHLSLAGTYNLLLSDLARLNEFITAPDLGKP